MTNILTAPEAAAVLRCAEDDVEMLALLPIVDKHIKMATGRDWTQDNPVEPLAKSAARMLLVRLHEDPGAMAAGQALGLGLSATLTQLEAVRLNYVEIEGLPSAGYIVLPSASAGDVVTSVTGLTTGLTGDQSALFETVITECGYIRQISDNDLDDYYFRVRLTPLSEQ